MQDFALEPYATFIDRVLMLLGRW